MKLTPVESSNVDAAGYDGSTEVLRIRFRSGGTYDYVGVPADVAEAFFQSKSPGSFVARIIRPGSPCEKVEDMASWPEKPKSDDKGGTA